MLTIPPLNCGHLRGNRGDLGKAGSGEAAGFGMRIADFGLSNRARSPVVAEHRAVGLESIRFCAVSNVDISPQCISTHLNFFTFYGEALFGLVRLTWLPQVVVGSSVRE
jgi:hypothetical protein